MKTAEIIRTAKPLVLYPPTPKIDRRIPVYTIPPQSKLAGKKAFIPNYPDTLFRNTHRIDRNWLSQRQKEIALVNSHPQILVVDVADHCQKDYELTERFARLANQRGHGINLDTLRTFAYAHDLGRMATGGKNPRFLETLASPYHGVIGREMFIHFSKRFKAVRKNKLAKLCLSLAKICSSHTAGVGFVNDSNRALGILPHGKRYFEDDLVWGEPGEHFIERLLIGVSDAKNFYIRNNFQYQGKTKIHLNDQNLIEIDEGPILIDRLVRKIYLKLGTILSTLLYREISDWGREDKVAVEFESGNPIKEITLEESHSGTTTFNIEGDKTETLTLPHFELLYIGGGKVFTKELQIASREAVHARFDHFHKRNKANIDRAFDEVVQLVGEENRRLVDEGWFDPKRIPT